MSARPRTVRREIRRSLPCLALGVALGIATMPAWRPMIFGGTPTLEDLLAVRCRPW